MAVEKALRNLEIKRSKQRTVFSNQCSVCSLGLLNTEHRKLITKNRRNFYDNHNPF